MTTKRLHSVRIDDATWVAAMQKAEERDEVLSDVIREALRRYARRRS